MPSRRPAGIANGTTENVLDNSPNVLSSVTGFESGPLHNDNMTESWIPPDSDSFWNFQVPAMDDLLPLHTANTPLKAPSGSLFTEKSSYQGRTTDAIIRLSQLNESLARHKCEMEAFPWGIPPGENICAGTADDIEASPISQALHTASEYLAILEWLLSLPTRSNESPATTPSYSDPSSSETSHGASSPSTLVLQPENPKAEDMYPFSRTIMLLLLSSYLQIIELYGCIFARISQTLADIPDKDLFFQKSPEFRVPGIPRMKAQLFIRVMAQVSENHLHTIERLMGLPQEFCLSTQTNGVKGIFSGVESSGLLRMALGRPGEGRETNSAASLVASLKESLQSLSRMLPT
jgi:hypothetical protein